MKIRTWEKHFHWFSIILASLVGGIFVVLVALTWYVVSIQGAILNGIQQSLYSQSAYLNALSRHITPTHSP